ncbi:MAG: hypothetical protein F4052_08535 [Dehalococcoidia bacterium]|nr:hypothetical protein [Dehalococcoidia bacterium]MYK26973.1 hypothetical protein [Dehalococcoidia bacterium]
MPVLDRRIDLVTYAKATWNEHGEVQHGAEMARETVWAYQNDAGSSLQPSPIVGGSLNEYTYRVEYREFVIRYTPTLADQATLKRLRIVDSDGHSWLIDQTAEQGRRDFLSVSCHRTVEETDGATG